MVSEYELHRLAYLRGGLNETETRREFIDPLFELLGSDIGNKAANASAYKDEVHEDSLKVAGATKAPDYSVRIGETRKFFVEAKKPAIDIMEDPEPAFQLRRYAWSAQLPPGLSIDDRPLRDMIGGLYYPRSPYEFSVLPADILGQVYEQLLGKVIRLLPNHRARVEEKPEVKKAGGVYYTPGHISERIVDRTLGALLTGRRPTDIDRVRVLDPACGSGSFLIVAYQRLLDWHRDFYVRDGVSKHARVLFQGPEASGSSHRARENAFS